MLVDFEFLGVVVRTVLFQEGILRDFYFFRVLLGAMSDIFKDDRTLRLRLRYMYIVHSGTY